MSRGSKICPECGALNSLDQQTCVRCQTPFPGPLGATLRTLVERVLGRELPMTKLFVGMCGLVFAFLTLDTHQLSIMGSDVYWSALRWGALAPLLGLSEPWRMLSATYVHFGILHIVFNMMATIDLGKLLERLIGSSRFMVALLSSALVGFVVSEVWSLNFGPLRSITGGASGGIFGLGGVLIGYLYARRDPAWKQIGIRIAVYAALFAVVFPVNNAAHIGGFVAGAPLGYIFYKEARPWRRHALFRTLAGILIVGSIVSVVLSERSPVWEAQRAVDLRRR